MKTKTLLLVLIAGSMARADFSYTMTRKTAQGGGETTKTAIKGQKMMIDSGSSVTILDFDAQTITTIRNAQKSYSVTKFSDVHEAPGGGAEFTADFKETGQKKVINGFNASELLLTVDADAGRSGMKMQMEVHIWVSPDVPGGQELRAFYRKNGAHFPWTAMAPAANASMARSMTDLQRKMASLDGVPVLEVIKTKMGGGPGMTAQQQAQMDQARARLEEMQKQGGAQAAAAQQALARMGQAGGGSGFETTMEGANYSTASIPDSAFAIPAGYTQASK